MYTLAGDNSYGQIGDNTKIQTTYYKKIGFRYLDYKDKTVEIGDNSYQIDLSKLRYLSSDMNVFMKEIVYPIGELKFTSLDETIANVDEKGNVTGVKNKTGITRN